MTRQPPMISRTDLKPYCLLLETTPNANPNAPNGGSSSQYSVKHYDLLLKSDEELYSWQVDIYSRSPLMGVSNPTNFVHKVHVGFDPISGVYILIFRRTRFAGAPPLPGAFTGMPEQRSRLLTKSAITREVCYALLPPFGFLSFFCFDSTVIFRSIPSQTGFSSFCSLFVYLTPLSFRITALARYLVFSHIILLSTHFPYVPVYPYHHLCSAPSPSQLFYHLCHSDLEPPVY